MIKTRITVTFEETDVYAMLDKMIVHENKEQLLTLLTPLIGEQHKGCELFIKLCVSNKALPKRLPIGALCYLPVTKLGYEANKKLILNSDLSNNEEMVIVKIKSWHGYHNYSEYYVTYTNISDTGTREKKECGVASSDLIEIEEI